MTRRDAILRAVAAGTCTSTEIANSCGISVHLAAAHLNTLWRQGKLDRFGPAPQIGGKRSYRYAVPLAVERT